MHGIYFALIVLWAVGTGVLLPEAVRLARASEPRKLIVVRHRRATPRERQQAWDGIGQTAERVWSR